MFTDNLLTAFTVLGRTIKDQRVYMSLAMTVLMDPSRCESVKMRSRV